MRWQSVWLTACSGALAAALAGCGGGDDGATTQAQGPKIERSVAEHLADLSDQVADDIERGDSCAAARTAAELRAGVTEAINAGKVPEPYLEDLSGVTNEIQAQAGECAPTTSTEEDEDDDKPEHGKKKGKRKRKKDDDEHRGTTTASTQTETLPPETTTTEPATTETTTDATTTGTTTGG